MPTPIKPTSNTWKHYALMCFLALVWGSSFLLIKKGLEVYSPWHVAAMRIFFAFLTLVPFSLRYLRMVPAKIYFYAFLTGLFGSGIPPFLFSYAQQYVDSSLAGILNGLTPLFTLLIGIVLFKAGWKPAQFTGVGLGLVGAMLLVILAPGGISLENGFYGILILTASASYGMGANIMKHQLQGIHPISVSILVFLFLGPIAGVFLFSTGIVNTTLTTPGSYTAMAHVAILGIVGTGIATILFNRLIQETTAVFASAITFLIPMVAMSWGWLDGETIGLGHFLGMIFILSGVYLTGKGK